VAEGITRVEDLPKAKVIIRSRNYKGCRCPCCGRRAYRLRRAERLLHDLGDLKSGRPHAIHYSQHHCSHCGHYFNADTSDLALPGSQWGKKRQREWRGITSPGRSMTSLAILPPTNSPPVVLFERRCRSETALQKLAKLRRWVCRFCMLRDAQAEGRNHTTRILPLARDKS